MADTDLDDFFAKKDKSKKKNKSKFSASEILEKKDPLVKKIPKKKKEKKEQSQKTESVKPTSHAVSTYSIYCNINILGVLVVDMLSVLSHMVRVPDVNEHHQCCHF